MAVLSPVLMERIPFHGSTGILFQLMQGVFILLHRLIGAIFIGEVYFYGDFVIYQESLAG
jgi:hypothetical protein